MKRRKVQFQEDGKGRKESVYGFVDYIHIFKYFYISMLGFSNKSSSINFGVCTEKLQSSRWYNHFLVSVNTTYLHYVL